MAAGCVAGHRGRVQGADRQVNLLSPLPGWVKPVGFMVLIALVLAGSWSEAWHMKARLDKADADALLVSQQATTIATLESNAKTEADTRQRNKGIDHDAQPDLDAAAARAADLARRLHACTAQVQLHPSPVPTDHSGREVPPEGREPSGPSEVERAGADYDAACQRDAIRHDALIEELLPQLKALAERAR